LSDIQIIGDDGSLVLSNEAGGSLLLTADDGAAMQLAADDGGAVTLSGEADAELVLFSEKATFGIPSGGSAGQVLAKVSGADYDAGWVSAAVSVFVRIAASIFPADPGVGLLVDAVVKYCGQPSLVVRAGQGVWNLVQPLVARMGFSLWVPTLGSAVVPGLLGCPTLTALGTATARAPAATNKARRMARLGYVSVATVGGFAGHYPTVLGRSLGDGTDGGFLYIFRFVVSDAAAVAGARMFCGLRNAVTAPTNVEPSTLTNQIGVAQLSTSNMVAPRRKQLLIWV
jgi:hypothetical protein